MVKYLLALKHLPIQPNFAKQNLQFLYCLNFVNIVIIWLMLRIYCQPRPPTDIGRHSLFQKYYPLFSILSHNFLKQFAKAFQIFIVDFQVVFFNLILNWSLLSVDRCSKKSSTRLSEVIKSVVRGKIVLIWFGGGGIGKSGPAGLGENRQQWIFDKATQLWEKSYKSQILWLW